MKKRNANSEKQEQLSASRIIADLKKYLGGCVFDALRGNNLSMFKVEHTSPDPMFTSRVTYGYGRKKLFAFFAETTGLFLLTHGSSIIQQLEPKYAIVSPANEMHNLTNDDLLEFNAKVRRFGATLVLYDNRCTAEELRLADELSLKPRDAVVLPKIVPSLADSISS